MTRILTLTFSLLFAIVSMAAPKKFVLVIDAGHGGHDAGAVGSFSKEKDINLNTALAFGRYVEQNCSDVKVIYTRKTDVFIPLNQRADIANKNHADVFISIHTNSLPAGKIARGFETYTMGMRRSDEKLSAAQRENSVITYEKGYRETYAGYDPNSPESAIMFEFINDKNMAESVELAKMVQKEVCSSANRPDKGVKQDVFLVLRETSMPACLIELGFISTPDEEKLLNNKDNIDKMARAIYSAFVKYKNKKKKIASTDNTPENEAPLLAAAATQTVVTEKPATEQKPVAEQKPAAETVVATAEPAAKTKRAKSNHVRRPEPNQTGGVATPASPTQSQTERQNRKDGNELIAKKPKEEGKQYVVVYNSPENNAPVTAKSATTDAKPATVDAKSATADAKPAETQKNIAAVKSDEKKDTVTIVEKAKEVAAVIDKPKEVATVPVVTEKPKEVAVVKTDTVAEPKPSTPVFKVQFMTSSKLMEDGAREYRGLTGTSFYKDGISYKYTVGECATFKEATELKKTVLEKFPDAFVVALLDGQRIDLAEARKMEKK